MALLLALAAYAVSAIEPIESREQAGAVLERARQEATQVEQRYQEAQRACRGTFFVNPCLSDARREHDRQVREIRAREVAARDAMRRIDAQERARTRAAEKGRDAPARGEPLPREPEAGAAAAAQRRPGAPPRASEGEALQRKQEQEAQQHKAAQEARAARAKDKQGQDEQAAAERAESVRRYEERQRAARAHAAEKERAAAENAARRERRRLERERAAAAGAEKSP